MRAGRFTRRLASLGAEVTGIDWSVAMIETALRHEREVTMGIEYRVMDAQRIPRTWPPATFDRVVACMSLMDMPRPEAAVRAARRLLRADGRFAFSISHPVNTAFASWEYPTRSNHGAMKIDRYFDEGPRETEWEMKRLSRPFTTPYWHRTFESWFSLLRRAGFEIDSVAEPRASEQDVRAVPVLGGSRSVPFFLVMSCHPSPTRAAPHPKRAPFRKHERK